MVRITGGLIRVIADALSAEYEGQAQKWDNAIWEDVACVVVSALGKRRCERCRHPKWLTEFPDPHNGCDVMRPFCFDCTNYVDWATS